MSIGNNFCFKCGEALAPRSQFCIKCGTRIPQATLGGDAQVVAPVAPAQAMSIQAMSTAMPIQTDITATHAQIMVSTTPLGQITPGVPVKVTEKYIWGLACAGLVSGFLSGFFVSFILSRIHHGEPDGIWEADFNAIFPWVSIVLYFILNTLFIFKDLKEIKNVGQKAESWMWLGVFFSPIYIGVREYKTNKNYWPLVVIIALRFSDYCF